MKNTMKILITLSIILVICNLFWYEEYVELGQHNISGFNETSLTLSYLLADIGRWLNNMTNNTIKNYGYVGIIILRIIPLTQSLHDLTGRKEYLELRDGIQSLSEYFDEIYLSKVVYSKLHRKISNILLELSNALRANDLEAIKRYSRELVNLTSSK